MSEVIERDVAPSLRKIGESVKSGEIGSFETGHGFKHHYSVARDALYIARTDKVMVDTSALLVAGCIHDFEQRGGVKPDDLDRYLRDDLALEDEFVGKVVDAVRNHSLDDTPSTIEGEVIWVADKANYLSVERFQGVVDYVESLIGDENKDKAIKHYYDTLAKKWVRGTVEIPHSQLMKKYPTATKLFQKRLDETLKYIEGEGNHVFNEWLQLYKEEHNDGQR